MYSPGEAPTFRYIEVGGPKLKDRRATHVIGTPLRPHAMVRNGRSVASALTLTSTTSKFVCPEEFSGARRRARPGFDTVARL